jgi:hypothetical protein
MLDLIALLPARRNCASSLCACSCCREADGSVAQVAIGFVL